MNDKFRLAKIIGIKMKNIFSDSQRMLNNIKRWSTDNKAGQLTVIGIYTGLQ